jgi:hypothetical protein
MHKPQIRRPNSIIVVESALHDDEAFAIDPVNEAMPLRDASRPPALEIVFERLGLADA